MRNIYLKIPDLRSFDSPLVLATVTRTLGSTPQKPGSSALFGKKGLIAGTIGGGIVEGKVQELAARAVLTKNSGYFHFNLANDISRTDEAICGGNISVLLDAGISNSVMPIGELGESLSKKIPGVLITGVKIIQEGKVDINRYWISTIVTPALPDDLLKRLIPESQKLISEKNQSGFTELEIFAADDDTPSLFFLQPFFPPDQLVIAGAGHIGKALAHLGSLLGFEVMVIDDRPDFANELNIPDADHIIVKDIGKAMQELEKGEGTYVVIVTRGHKDDASALRPCIGKGLAYLGMIGSKNKISAMRINFIENGWTSSEQWDRIHAPVGLAIKSQTVEEIAISIAAELVLVRNSKR